jgi:hypothetical protein
VPAVPIRDLEVHPRDGDLVLGTHGRGILIIDDIRPLRALASDPTLREAAVHVFDPPPALAVSIAEGIGYRSTGHAMQQGEVRAQGALLSFWASESGPARLEVTTDAGDLVLSRDLSAEAGVNRVDWDLRPGGDADELRFPSQMMVLPGAYTVTVRRGDESASTELDVLGDPRSGVSTADLRAKLAALQEMAQLGEQASEAQDELEKVLHGVETVLGTLGPDEEELRDQGTSLRDATRTAMERLFTGPECAGLCRSVTVVDPVQTARRALSSAEGAPSANEQVLMERAREAVRVIESEVGELMAGAVAGYRDALRSAGYTPFGNQEDGDSDS